MPEDVSFFKNLWELGNERNKIDRLETYGVKHGWDWYQTYTIKIFVYIFDVWTKYVQIYFGYIHMHIYIIYICNNYIHNIYMQQLRT